MSLFDSTTIVDFMRNNIVKCGVTNPEGRLISDRGTVKIRPIEAMGNIGGKPMGKVYWFEFVNAADTSDDLLEIYWAPYYGNDVAPPTILGNGSHFMFTAVMSGCSFGVGSSPGNGVVGVSHANAMNSGDKSNTGLEGDAAMSQQKNVQQHMLYSEDVSQRIISYDAYMKVDGALDLGMQSTTFGVHELNQSWSFYTLKYKYLGGGSYVHFGVERQISGVV